MYTDRDHRRGAIKAANLVLQNDPAQSQALVESTMSPKEFVSKLIIPKPKASSVTVEQGLSEVGSSSIDPRPEIPLFPVTLHSELSRQHTEAGSLPGASDTSEMLGSTGDKPLDFENMNIEELHQYLLDHGKSLGTDKSSCITQCIAIALCNDSNPSLPLGDRSKKSVAGPSSSVTEDEASNSKPGILQRFVNSIL